MITKIPLRISFIGGGTDIAPFFVDHGGYTLSTTIDKYAIIAKNERDIPELDNYKDLKEAALKLCAKELPYKHSDIRQLRVACEIPPGSGLGTSSAIAVGLTLQIFEYLNKAPDFIAKKAIELERVHGGILGGIQDQYNAAYPGLNRFRFNGEYINKLWRITSLANVKIETEVIPYHKFAVDKEDFSNRLLLVDTGIIRRQNNLMATQIERTTKEENDKALFRIKDLVELAHETLLESNWEHFGNLLSQSWELKKSLSKGINVNIVDEILKTARDEKLAYGGKLLGAGGGGYVLLICENREVAYYKMTAKGYRCIKPNIVEDYIIE